MKQKPLSHPLRSSLSALLACSMILQMAAPGVAMAMAPDAIPVPGNIPAPVAPAPLDPALIAPKPQAQAPADAAPAPQSVHAKTKTDSLPYEKQEPSENAAAKTLCYNRPSLKADDEEFSRLQNNLQASQITHAQYFRTGINPKIIDGQKYFGQMIKDSTTGKNGVCNYKRQTELRLAELRAQMQDTNSSQEHCVRAESLYEFVRRADLYQKSYASGVKKLRLGDNSQKPVFVGLVERFKTGSETNWKAIADAKSQAIAIKAEIAAGSRPLEDEFAILWGKEAQKKSAADLVKPNGSKAIYAELLDKLYYEQKHAESLAETLTSYNRKLSGNFNGCGLGDPTAKGAKPGKLVVPNKIIQVSDPEVDEGPDLSGVTQSKAEEAADKIRPGSTEEQIKAKRDRRDFLLKEKSDRSTIESLDKEIATLEGRTPSPSRKPPTSDDDYSDDSVRRRREASRRYHSNLPDPVENPLRNRGRDDGGSGQSTASDFLSNNAGLLVGGTLIVGGGVGLYLWDKNEQKKRDNEWKAYWNSVQAANPSSTTTTTTTDTTRRLTNRSAVGNAVVGINLPGLQVAITDTAGNTLTGQDTDLVISCVNPIPCTLTGTTSVRTVSGVATFTDLKFTGPHTGVRLRYSTSWGGIEQSNGFDVTESAPNRQ